MSSEDTQSRFAATFADELARNGVREVVVAPGKRSSLFAAAFARHPDLRVTVIPDERVAAFFALGIGISSRQPALLWCTSGTAVAECHAAVLEADASCVPMLIATADRPTETHHVNDWQTCDQDAIFGDATRWRFSVAADDVAVLSSVRSITCHAIAACNGEIDAAWPGPVHVNIQIREPISLKSTMPVEGRAERTPWHVTRSQSSRVAKTERMQELVHYRNGLILVGRGGGDADAVLRASLALGWPVLADARSGVRVRHASVLSVAELAADALRGCVAMRPDVVLHLGEPLISPRLSAWLATCVNAGTAYWHVAETDPFRGHASLANHIMSCHTTEFCEALARVCDRSSDHLWLRKWRSMDDTARQVLLRELMAETTEVTEPQLAHALFRELPKSTTLSCASSMPIRDVEWFAMPRDDVHVFANRGLSGIDGVLSTSFGIASQNATPSVVIVGDLALLHDIGVFWAARSAVENFPQTIVVFDNNGGGIFETFKLEDELGTDVYDSILRTPHNMNVVSMLRGFDIPVVVASSLSDAVDALANGCASGQTNVVYIRTDAKRNTEMRNNIRRRVCDAVAELLRQM